MNPEPGRLAARKLVRDLAARGRYLFSEFDAPLREAWAAVAAQAHWLGASDRLAAELAARATAALRASPAPTPALLAAVSRAYAALGLNPQSRGELAAIAARTSSTLRAGEVDPLDKWIPRLRSDGGVY